MISENQIAIVTERLNNLSSVSQKMTDEIVERYLSKCQIGEYIYCEDKKGSNFVGMCEGT